MLRLIDRLGLALRVPRAFTVVILASGVGAVACGDNGGGLDAGATVGAVDDGAANPGPGTAPANGVLETGCGCSTSANLQALSCASSDGVPITGSGLEVAPSGDIALFTLCYSRDGEFPADHCRAFRWTRAGGSEALVDAGYHVGLADDGSALIVETQDEDPRETLVLVGPDGARTNVPLNHVARLSANGRYVVGFVPQLSYSVAPGDLASPTPLSPSPLARWSLADGLETLAEIPDGLLEGMVFDVTADASVIVGAAYLTDGTLRHAPLLYTAQQGLRRPEGSPGVEPVSIDSVSRDGSAFAGLASSSLGNDLVEAYYGTTSGGFRHITTMNPGAGVGSYQALSDDGLVLAGTGWPADVGRPRVYRWTAEGLTWLGPDDAAGRIADMTADGTLVLGVLVDGDQGFIASPGETRRLSELLERASVDSTGWELKAPLRISDDGKVVFGSALCGGVATRYRWVLPD
jgi:hypothetical protein